MFVGLGIGDLFITYPLLSKILKYLGVLYIIYLALTFFIPNITKKKSADIKFGIINGIIVQLTNAKGYILLIVMFSAFTNTDQTSFLHVFQLSLSLALLNFSAHLLWVSAGSMIQKKLYQKPQYKKINDYFFGLMLIFVAVDLVF